MESMAPLKNITEASSTNWDKSQWGSLWSVVALLPWYRLVMSLLNLWAFLLIPNRSKTNNLSIKELKKFTPTIWHNLSWTTSHWMKRHAPFHPFFLPVDGQDHSILYSKARYILQDDAKGCYQPSNSVACRKIRLIQLNNIEIFTPKHDVPSKE